MHQGLCRGLHVFGDDVEAQAMCHRDDGLAHASVEAKHRWYIVRGEEAREFFAFEYAFEVTNESFSRPLDRYDFLTAEQIFALQVGDMLVHRGVAKAHAAIDNPLYPGIDRVSADYYFDLVPALYINKAR